MRKVWWAASVFCIVAVCTVNAQFGGGSMPVPWGHKKKSDAGSANQPVQTIEADGVVISNDGKTIKVYIREEERMLTLKLNAKTDFTKKSASITGVAVLPRSTVHVQAAEDDDAFLNAVHVDVTKDPPVDSDAPAGVASQNPIDPKTVGTNDEERIRPTILAGSDNAPHRPVLRRGIPKQTGADDEIEKNETSSTAAPAKPDETADTAKPDKTKTGKAESEDFTIGGDADVRRVPPSSPKLIAQTKEWLRSFNEGLPNYVCQQFTTRYIEQSKSAGWQPQDIVTATVVYQDGNEEYRDITIGGKKTNKQMMDIGGSTSVGEFATQLQVLFDDRSQAKFKPYQSTTIGRTPATIFDFNVPLHNADWTITVGGQSIRPTYSGSVWLDKANGQVRRIELQADKIPHDFPMDSVQASVDYEYVHLGTSTYLLPVHAENLDCQRGSTICSKNTIDFRNYHKYSGESTITFE